MTTFGYFTKINEIVNNLKYIEVFLRRFPARKFYEENDINQLVYSQYHFEVFMHKIHTILELMKLMLNAIYELGIPERDCSWDNLKDRDEIKKSKAYPILNSYYSKFKAVIDARHLNTHRAVFNDAKKDRLDVSYGIYNAYEELSLEIDDEYKKNMPKLVLDWRIKDYRKNKLKLVEGSKKVVEKHVKMFFESIADEFVKRRDYKAS
ncbi:MAG: hypothetical protein MAG431_01193 [Chloroflexi bacterium]|nr:hypothetical protein [Chloroflexota bacterium]